MLRRRSSPDPQPPTPEWQRRFDEATTLLLSRDQPAWVHSRLDDLRRALADANEVAQRLDASVQRLDPDQTAAELKRVLRQRANAESPAAAADLERRVTALRERYDAVNELINRRETIHRQMLGTADDVELLAVQAVRTEALDADPADHLETHLARLDSDLHALELARREVDELG